MPLSVEYLQKLKKDTRLQNIEWFNCHDDPYYFLTNWAKTLDVHDEKNPIKCFPDKEYIKILVDIWLNNQLLLVLKSRQMMMSWLFTTLYLWDVIFHEARMIFFQSKKAEDADDILKRSKFVWDNLPKFLKKYYKNDEFYELKCNPQHNGQHVSGKMVFPDINSEIRAIPEGGDVIRMHVASGILCIGHKIKVLTSKLKWITADSIRIGDILAGFDEEIGNSGFKSNGIGVARQWKNSIVEEVVEVIRPSYELIFSNGTKVICSKEHLWLSGYKQTWKWITTDKLKVKTGDGYGSKVIKFIDVWEDNNDYDCGYLSGIYDGEGTLYQKSFNNHDGIGSNLMLAISQNEGRVLEYIKYLLKKKGFNFNIRHIKDDRYTKQHYQLEIGAKVEIMKFLGWIRPKRLLKKMDLDQWGTALAKEGVELIGRKFLGNRKLIGFKTSTKTFVAEGLASHNSDEMAFQPEAKDAFTASKPTISSKGRFTGVSTVEFGSFFLDLVSDQIEV